VILVAATLEKSTFATMRFLMRFRVV